MAASEHPSLLPLEDVELGVLGSPAGPQWGATTATTIPGFGGQGCTPPLPDPFSTILSNPRFDSGSCGIEPLESLLRIPKRSSGGSARLPSLHRRGLGDTPPPQAPFCSCSAADVVPSKERAEKGPTKKKKLPWGCDSYAAAAFCYGLVPTDLRRWDWGLATPICEQVLFCSPESFNILSQERVLLSVNLSVTATHPELLYGLLRACPCIFHMYLWDLS